MRIWTPILTSVAERQQTTLAFPDALNHIWARWDQGDHISLIGPTRSGKTFFKRYLLRRRNYVTSFLTKPADPLLDRIIKEEGFKKQTGMWDGSHTDLIALWHKKPKGKTQSEYIASQRYIFEHAINDMVDEGHWCLDFDELSYMCDFLGMDKLMRWLVQQGGSSKLSVVAATQRPAFIPLVFYSQPRWLVLWNNNDATDLKRIQGIGGVDGKVIRSEVMRLRRREILMVHNWHPYERIRTLVRV
jgi:hypothetical protein